MSKSPRYWVWVFGEVEGLRWVLGHEAMAFAQHAARRVATIREGDKAVLYVTRGAFHNPTRDEARLGGLAIVVGAPRLERVVIHESEFELIIPIQTHHLTPERKGPAVKPLVPRLSFVKRPEVWGGYFRNSPIEVSRRDFRVLESALNRWLER